MRFILSLIKDSITLDFRTLLIKEWSLYKKIVFILTKYKLLIKHFFRKFELGEDFVHFEGKKIFYDSKYGLAGYQGISCRHRKLLKNIANIQNAEVILDVGANVGFFSMLCRELYPDSKIYAFEPVPKTFSCLEKNFKDDDKTKIFNLALSDYTGKGKMNFNEENSLISSLSNDGNVDVEITTLDYFCKDKKINKIDILKIDTEGFEDFVLKGAQNTLSKVKYIIMEITIENNKNYTVSSLFKLLSAENFDFQILGFRNFNNRGEGAVSIMDVILENVLSVSTGDGM